MVTALNLLNVVQSHQGSIMEGNNMDLKVHIDFEKATLRNYAAYDLSAFNSCRNLPATYSKKL